MNGNLRVKATRIAADIDGLAELTEPGHPWTRRAFTPMFLEGRTFLTQAMRDAGLETRLDAAGNLIGRRAGRGSGRGVIMVGSHSDTVPDGGRFDGIAGVVAGIEIARALAEQNIELDHDLEIIDCLAEEVSLFGVSCIGSRAAAGVLPAEWLDRKAGDRTLSEGLSGVGGNPGQLDLARRKDVVAFLELHIEQGPVLEKEGIDIGVVTAIAGITRIEIRVEGRADHAGTTPMAVRSDALVAASELVLAIRRLASRIAALSSGHFTATVGEFSIEPGAANVVPSAARLLVDARAELRPDMETFHHRLKISLNEIAAVHGVMIAPPLVLSDNLPTPSAPMLLDQIEAAARTVGATHRRMASGAGHDMAWFARVAPAAMIFVACRDGRSHCPEEWAEAGAIALGSEVLFQTILRLDRRL